MVNAEARSAPNQGFVRAPSRGLRSLPQGEWDYSISPPHRNACRRKKVRCTRRGEGRPLREQPGPVRATGSAGTEGRLRATLGHPLSPDWVQQRLTPFGLSFIGAITGQYRKTPGERRLLPKLSSSSHPVGNARIYTSMASHGLPASGPKKQLRLAKQFRRTVAWVPLVPPI